MMKAKKREKKTTNLNKSTLDNSCFNASQIHIDEINPDTSFELWWKDKFRRPNQRQIYVTRHPGPSAHRDTDTKISKHIEPVSFLHDWDEWTED